MKTIKRLSICFLSLLILFTCFACKDKEDEKTRPENINTECSFAFTYFGMHNYERLDVTVTNNTDTTITSLKNLSIMIYFDDVEDTELSMKLSCSLIEFELPLGAGETTTVENVQGISNRSWSTNGWLEGKSYSKSSYGGAKYTVVYETNDEDYWGDKFY